jgi:hypothetical protein
MSAASNSDYVFFYVPSLASGIAFITVFSVFLAIHLLTSLRYLQARFFLYWGLGLIAEVIAYAGRIWVTRSGGQLSSAFIMEYVTISIAPSLLSIALYQTASQVYAVFNHKFLIINAKYFMKYLILFNIISGTIQGVGGGISSNYMSTEVAGNKGLQLMVAGLSLQVVSLLIFQTVWYIFLVRVYNSNKVYGDAQFCEQYHNVRERKYIYYFLATFSWAIIFIFIRTIYRLVEMSNGLTSKLATREIYFNVLDGMMIALACFCITLLPPHFVFGDNKVRKVSAMAKRDMS